MHERRAAFRAWRRSRPFWGGLLLLISGIELVSLPLSGVLTHGALKLVIYIGIGGVFGILIGILLMAAGVMCWVDKTHRIFYGIAGLVLGILSFPASNLGGFFLGMLLAIVGGSLAFAWTQIEPASVSLSDLSGPPAEDEAADIEDTESDDEEPTAGLDLITGEDKEAVEDKDDTDQDTRGRAGYRTLAVAAMPALVVAGLLAAPGNSASAASGGLCILGIICIGGSPSPSASASPSASSSTSASDESPATDASPCATPSASASASASPSPSPTASCSPSAGASPQPSASGSSGSSSSGSSTGSTSKKNSKKAAVKQATADPSLVASTATSVLTAGSVTLDNFQFDGLVDMPVAGGGTVQMMKFSASSADLTGNVTVSVTQDGTTTVTQSPSLAFSGDMTLYATKLSGTLLGIPLTFTPSTISSVLLTVPNLITGVVPITMTNVTTDQPLAMAAGLQTGALTIGF